MDIIAGLDPQQRAAATAPDGRSLIAAGAGTGKTRTLTARMAWLISSGKAAAHEIMAVTFTNKAAREIRERVRDAVGPKAAEIRLGTFHSLSCRILRRHAARVHLQSAGFAVIDEDEAEAVASAAALSSGAYPEFVPPAPLADADEKAQDAAVTAAKREWESGLRDFARQAQRQISRWKSWGLTAEAAADPGRPARSERDETFAKVYDAYQSELERRNSCDFGDLILNVVKLMEADPQIAESESSRVRYLLVDEAQDANSMQVRWAQLMSAHHGNLTVVGDEDQNIFAFQGGYPGAMREMAGSGAQEYWLTTNRRCTEEILAPANVIVDYNRRKKPKTLSSGMHGGKVTVSMHESEAQEAAAVAKRIHDLIEAGTPACEIACLVRAGYVTKPLEEALLRGGVPHFIVGGASLAEREEVKDVLAYVRLAVDPHSESDFRRISNKPVRGVGAAVTDTVCHMAVSRSIPFHEACLAVAAEPGSRMRKDAREGLSSVARALMLLAEDARYGRSAEDVLHAAMHDTGYVDWLKTREDGDKRIEILAVLERVTEECGDAVDLLHEIALLTDGDGSDKEASRVRISTIHSSKGLEFDCVFCPSFEEGVIPSPRAVDEGCKGKAGDPWNGPVGGGVEEERRLVHVAFTRARKGLHVSWSNQRTGFRGRATGPSCFVAECNLEITEPMTEPVFVRKKAKARAGRKGFERRGTATA